MSEPSNAVFAGPGEGELVAAGSNEVLIKLGAEAGLGCSMIEYSVGPRFVAPPVQHANTREDHAIYVLAGEVVFDVGERTMTVSAGASLGLPRGVKFAWRNERDEPARLLMVFVPGGFEGYFREVAERLGDLPAGPPNPEVYMPLITPLWEKYGVE